MPTKTMGWAGGTRRGQAPRARGASLLLLLAAVLGMICGGLLAAEPRLAHVYVVLEGPPACELVLSAKALHSAPPHRAVIKAHTADLRRRQAAFEKSLSARGGKTTGRVQRLVNAVRVRVPADQLETLRALPGVRQVTPVREYERHTATSVPFIGAPAVWHSATTNADGAGIRVGIIDSGIDYTHAAFGGSGLPADFAANDPKVIEPGTFPTPKVAGGYDFVGDDYDPDDPEKNTPRPDPDPIDCASSGHGTAVAAVAAGLGVLTNGATYSGPYTADLDFAQFAVGPGVAPRATLYALKVFGCRGTTPAVLDALEWAADPNDDGDFTDRLDVVNLSLGSPFGFDGPGDPSQDAVNRLVDLGAVVTVSAGNNGNTFYVLGSPAAAEKAITVANSLDADVETLGIRVLSPAAVAGVYGAVEGAITQPLGKTNVVEGQVVYVDPPLACEPLRDTSVLAGKIALIDRGVCFFTDKIQRAQDAGAIAVIMVNNRPGPPIAMGGTGAPFSIPGVMISQSDGELLKLSVASNLVGRIGGSVGLKHPEWADQISDSSSRGPVAPSSVLKPDLAAPGTDIFSALAGSGTNGVLLSGTSLAAPHVAGAAALLRQAHPDWPPATIKAALMNTAVPLEDPTTGWPCPESWMGAGRLRVDEAARAVMTASTPDPHVVGLSFGALELTHRYRETRQVQLVNHGDEPIPLEVTVSNTVPDAGVSLSPATPSVTVPARGTALATVELTVDPRQLDPSRGLSTNLISGLPYQRLREASGQVWFQGPQGAVHLPYHLAPRAASELQAPVGQLGLPVRSNLVELALPLVGQSAHPQPVVSVFELVAAHPVQGFTDPGWVAGDLVAVAVASDAPAQAQFTNSTVYFALAAAGNWTTPQMAVTRFEIDIDTDQDGAVDYQVLNGSAGNTISTNLFDTITVNDVFMPIIRNLAAGGWATNAFVNALPADQRETAPFNNSVIVLPVPVRLIGLTASHSGFRFDVRSYGPLQRRGPLIDVLQNLFFDAARPVIESTFSGLSRTPFHEDGQPLRLRVDRTVPVTPDATGALVVHLLLLHHFNTTDQRLDVVALRLDTEDADGDALPDLWELEHFGDLATASLTSDFDRDGATDHAEFIAGTDPRDAGSYPRLLPAGFDLRGSKRLQWPSFPNRLYTLERATNLTPPIRWETRASVPALPPTNLFTDITATGPGPYFYRLRLE